MKNIILYLLLLAISFPTIASNTTTRDEAINVAVQILHTEADKFNTPTLAENGKYFIVQTQNANGWVLVSTSKEIDPVIGYSNTGIFPVNDTNNPATNFISEHISSTTSSAKHSWSKVKAGALGTPQFRGSVEPLLQTQWGQYSPYNNHCPMIGNEQTLTGCVATAMAQILAYHKFPESGVGSKSYTREDIVGDISANFSETIYNWENMTDDDIGKLMFHCGVSTEMQYGIDSSYPFISFKEAFKDVFKYDYRIQIQNRPGFDDETWCTLLKNELGNQRPILYYTPSHAFIIDGYDQNGLFHINWGWRGSSDGYFSINSLSAEGYDYNSEVQFAITGIKPDYIYDQHDAYENLTFDNTIHYYEGVFPYGFIREESLIDTLPFSIGCKINNLGYNLVELNTLVDVDVYLDEQLWESKEIAIENKWGDNLTSNTIEFGALSAGEYTVTFAIDPHNKIPEITDEDNVREITFTVQSSGTITSESLIISSSEETFNPLASETEITFTSPFKWTASTNEPWISINTSSGKSGENDITISATENTETSQRIGTVTISTDGIADKTITITQRGKIEGEALVVYSTSEEYSYGSRFSNVTVYSTGNWTAKSNRSWITVYPSTGSAGYSDLMIMVMANTETVERTGTVTISSPGFDDHIISITQEAKPLIESLTLSSYSEKFTADTSLKSITLASTLDWNVTTDQPWLSTSRESGGAGNYGVAIFVSTNTETTERIGTVTFSGDGIEDQVLTVTQAGARKPLFLSSYEETFTTEASTKSIFVYSTLDWTAVTNQSWITINKNSGSTGNINIFISVSENTESTERSGTVTFSGNGVDDQIVTITQAGKIVEESLTVSSISETFTAEASESDITISSTVIWTASANQPWITFSDNSGSVGNTNLTISVSANTETTQRTGTVTISGNGVDVQTISITQAGEVGDKYLTLSSISETFTKEASERSISISSNVDWAATRSEQWISISHNYGNAGITNLTISVTENAQSTERTGTVAIFGDGIDYQTITITQTNESAPESLSISSSIEAFTTKVSESDITIISTVNWTASVNQSWISISDNSGSAGNTSLTISVSENTEDTERIGTVIISGNGVDDQIVTITQAGKAVSESLTVSSSAEAFTAIASENDITISSTVIWNASTNQPWISINDNTGSTGNTNLTISVSENTQTSERVGTITISGNDVNDQIVTITQAGKAVAESLTVSSSSETFTAIASENDITISSTVDWTASVNQSWISLSDNSGSVGNTSLSISVSENTEATQRTGTVIISGNGVNDQIVTITQAGKATTESLTVSSSSETFTAIASENDITISSTVYWTASVNQSWISLSDNSGSAGNTNLTISVSENTEATQRTGIVIISGNGVNDQIVTITQAGKAVAEPISVSSLTEEFSAEPSIGYVTISANSDWTASTDQTWIKLNVTEGSSGETELRILALTNSSNIERTGTITISANGSEDITISINQEAGTVTSITNEHAELHSATYPNPATSSIQISTKKDVYYSLLSQSGEIVLTVIGSGNDMILNVSNLPRGVYFIQSDDISEKIILIE